MFIALAGPIGSGKSTLSRALAETLDADLLAFGEYVRAYAKDHGLAAESRSVLQNVGQQLVERDPRIFVQDALAWAQHRPNLHLVLDGIRHESVWNEIHGAAGERGQAAKLIYLDIREDVRRQRLSARGLSETEITAFDNHPTERDLRERLRPKAHMLLEGEQELTALVQIAKGGLDVR
jgi:dephospho-CoA kinase